MNERAPIRLHMTVYEAQLLIRHALWQRDVITSLTADTLMPDAMFDENMSRIVLWASIADQLGKQGLGVEVKELLRDE